MAKLPSKNNEKKIKWNLTTKSKSYHDVAKVEILDFAPKIPDSKFPKLNFQTIFVQATEKNNVLVVFPHGGPHSAFGCEYSPHIAILFSLGYSVLLINYRGSTGFGQNSVDSLPGKIGTNDVNDCQVSILKKFSFHNQNFYIN